MCDPASAVAVASLAVTAAGTAYQVSEQQAAVKRANNAENERVAYSANVRRQEMNRQDEYANEAWQRWQDQLRSRGADAQQDVMAQGEQEVLDTTQRVRDATGLDAGMLPGQEGSTVAQVFTEDAARQGAERSREAKARIAALAALSGYDRANGYNRITGQRFDADQRMLSGMAGSSLRIAGAAGNLPAAQVAGPSQWGSLAAGAGNLGLQWAGRQGAGQTLAGVFAPAAQGGVKPIPAVGAGAGG